MPTQRPAAPAGEPATTRMPAAANNKKPRTPVTNANGPAPRSRRAAPPPVREDREIESWLGELRGNAPTPPPARPRPQQGAEPTTAIPTQRPRVGRSRAADPETTEKLNAQPEEEPRRRGGVSAQELLRREGRGT
jgi:trehalose monomycolate/heme transporter